MTAKDKKCKLRTLAPHDPIGSVLKIEEALESPGMGGCQISLKAALCRGEGNLRAIYKMLSDLICTYKSLLGSLVVFGHLYLLFRTS